MSVKQSQIKIRLLVLVLGCIMAAGLACFWILWVYRSSNSSQNVSITYINAYQQLKWLYKQKEGLSEEYFIATQKEYFKQLEEDGAHVYLFKYMDKKDEAFLITPLHATKSFSDQYDRLKEKELKRILSVATKDKRKPVLAIFEKGNFHPIILYGHLQDNYYLGILSQQTYFNINRSEALMWSILGFLLFAGGSISVIVWFGKRLDETMLRLDTANKNLALELEQKEQLYLSTKHMLANLSHDLKTPVTLIQVYAEALKDDIYPETERQGLYHTIITETQYLSQLINRIVALAKLEGAVQTLRPTIFSLHDLSLGCYQRFLLSIKEKNIQFILPKDEELLVMADYTATEQIIVNLLENAVHYTEHGGNIKLFYKTTPTTVRLNLFNAHEPIPEEKLSKLFENFYRNEASRSQKGHYGLGLAIVKSASSLMGGTCGAYNVSEGVIFFVELPLGRM